MLKLNDKKHQKGLFEDEVIDVDASSIGVFTDEFQDLPDAPPL
ncbi:MAG: hypothetical protein ACJAWL_001911 [Motiliproteus sp.]